jgi:hypothetical protein
MSKVLSGDEGHVPVHIDAQKSNGASTRTRTASAYFHCVHRRLKLSGVYGIFPGCLRKISQANEGQRGKDTEDPQHSS